MRKIRLLFAGAALAVLLMTGAYAEGGPEAAAGGLGALDISGGGRTFFSLKSVSVMNFKPDVWMQFGFFRHKKKALKEEALTMSGAGGGIGLSGASGASGEISFENTAAGNMRVTVSVKNPSPDARGIRLSFSCGAKDMFWGFGEQYSYADLRGQTVPIWVQEQGVGRAKVSNFPPVGSFSDTYFPMPYFMDPAAGKGFLLENSEFSQFNLCGKDSGTWDVEVWNAAKVSFIVLPGPKPADVVKQFTAEAGRPKQAPPDWALGGVWIASQRGPDVLWQRVDAALKAGIPISAIWAQDWVGERHFGTGNHGVKYRWIWDKELYPDLPGIIKRLNEKNIRFLGYFNPFIVMDYDHFAEAKEKGYLVKDKNGEPYIFQIITFKGGLVDVTNPAAAEWFKGYAREAVRMGMKGWMCDFGEWLPFDAVLYAGSGEQFHNLYTTAWHRINREVLDEAYPDGDYAILTRSGFTGEQKVVQFAWTGDQEQDWQDADGLPTVVTASLNIGLSGIPYFTNDIAGFSGGPSTKELFQRWTELGAFSPVMRTHDGLKKFENHRFDSDAETLAHFTKMSKIHAALLPYLKAIAGDAVTEGLPMIRHTVLVDPDWEKAYTARWQWMLGPDLLFAPVIAKGAAEVEVAFPEGEWIHLLTGERFNGRTVAKVAAPIGTPAAFGRAGKLDDIAKVTKAIAEK